MNTFPLDDAAEACALRIRTNAAAFDPDVKVVEFDHYWRVNSTAAELEARLPCVLLQFSEAAYTHEQCQVTQRNSFVANYLYSIKGKNRINPLKAIRTLCELLTVGEQFDEIPELVEALGSSTFVSIEVKASALDNSLVDKNVGWASVTFEILNLSQ